MHRNSSAGEARRPAHDLWIYRHHRLRLGEVLQALLQLRLDLVDLDRHGLLADRFARLLEYAQDRSPARGRRQHISRDIGELQRDESETVNQSVSPPGLDRPLEETGIDDPMHLLQWNAGRSRRLVGRERLGLEHDSPRKTFQVCGRYMDHGLEGRQGARRDRATRRRVSTGRMPVTTCEPMEVWRLV